MGESEIWTLSHKTGFCVVVVEGIATSMSCIDDASGLNESGRPRRPGYVGAGGDPVEVIVSVNVSVTSKMDYAFDESMASVSGNPLRIGKTKPIVGGCFVVAAIVILTQTVCEIWIGSLILNV
jgi:hypothetical protein